MARLSSRDPWKSLFINVSVFLISLYVGGILKKLSATGVSYYRLFSPGGEYPGWSIVGELRRVASLSEHDCSSTPPRRSYSHDRNANKPNEISHKHIFLLFSPGRLSTSERQEWIPNRRSFLI